jgi:hypothetical protein
VPADQRKTRECGLSEGLIDVYILWRFDLFRKERFAVHSYRSANEKAVGAKCSAVERSLH